MGNRSKTMLTRMANSELQPLSSAKPTRKLHHDTINTKANLPTCAEYGPKHSFGNEKTSQTQIALYNKLWMRLPFILVDECGIFKVFCASCSKRVNSYSKVARTKVSSVL